MYILPHSLILVCLRWTRSSLSSSYCTYSTCWQLWYVLQTIAWLEQQHCFHNMQVWGVSQTTQQRGPVGEYKIFFSFPQVVLRKTKCVKCDNIQYVTLGLGFKDSLCNIFIVIKPFRNHLSNWLTCLRKLITVMETSVGSLQGNG